MIEKLMIISLKNRLLIVLLVFLIIAFGLYQYNKLPVDAFPDISPVMVPVFAEAHGMAPEEIERFITYPIESAMNGLPSVTKIKSTSAFGMAVIYIYFEDSVDIYFARQIVAQRLVSATADLPEMHEPPVLGPISSGLGQIFMYYLVGEDNLDCGGKEKNTYLREINDWIVKIKLQSIKGVTDILSIGGHVLQYQIKLNPYSMAKYDISLNELIESVRNNNKNAGGQFLVINSEEYLLRGIGLLTKKEDIQNIPIKNIKQVPITIKDIARVEYGNEIRRGVVTRNGEEEVVSGMVLQLYNENTSEVIKNLYEKISEIQSSLPKGVKLIPYYEQAELVNKATLTVIKALLIGALLVVLTLIIFLGNIRTALIVTLSLPICAFITFIMMGFSGLSANLMSLGGLAIAIGMLADGSIVIVENISRKFAQNQLEEIDKKEVILQASREVARPILFSTLIIVIVLLPIFTLEGIEGKMFSPIAYTISFALIGSLFTALIVSPVICSIFLKKDIKVKIFIIDKITNYYHFLLKSAIKTKKYLLSMIFILFLISIFILFNIGTEFMPRLEEGSIQIGVTMAPSISLEKATETIKSLEKEIVKFPEVHQTISRIGRPETGSHPHPINYAEIFIALEDVNKWKNFGNKNDLINKIDKRLKQYPGVQLNFSQPIQNAFDELLSGVKTDIAINIFGEDLSVLRNKANEIKNIIENVEGLKDLFVEQSFGQPQVQIIPDRQVCARYNVDTSEIIKLIEIALGGEVIDNIYINNRSFGIHVRYDNIFRDNVSNIENLLVTNKDGINIPLSLIASIKKLNGPIQINREKNQRKWTVQANIRGRDLGSVISDIKHRINEKLSMPPGYTIEFGGQFENQQRAMRRLAIIIPIILTLIFIMLYLNFASIKLCLLIILNVPLALIGGVFGLLIMGEFLSVPAAVGFIALFGIAIQNGLVLVTYIKDLRLSGLIVEKAVIEGALLRVRPVLMTALTTVLGLSPLLFSKGIGSEIQRPLATVVIFGLITSTFLTLFMIPAIYRWFDD
ncbi:MAG: CusA/CzcA family heavy metal efflux RND transporter [Pseudomonadota bacterium]